MIAFTKGLRLNFLSSVYCSTVQHRLSRSFLPSGHQRFYTQELGECPKRKRLVNTRRMGIGRISNVRALGELWELNIDKY
ncbi:hypothetical protein J6590_016232 [Homalodisca vitripennis]|nr:hypothetical protein J6590_016232 [Homalodisca vitripennis]